MNELVHKWFTTELNRNGFKFNIRGEFLDEYSIAIDNDYNNYDNYYMQNIDSIYINIYHDKLKFRCSFRHFLYGNNNLHIDWIYAMDSIKNFRINKWTSIYGSAELNNLTTELMNKSYKKYPPEFKTFLQNQLYVINEIRYLINILENLI